MLGPYTASRITFAAQSNPLKGKHIIAADPVMGGTMLLSDGSAVLIYRDVDGDGAIKGATYLPVASCRFSDWAERERDRRKRGDIEIGWLGGSATESLRLERVGITTRLSRIIRRPDENGKLTQVVAPLIVTERRIEAFGVSPRPIDSPGDRGLITVARESDNSILIVAYGLP